MWQSNIFLNKIPPLLNWFSWCLKRRNHTSNRQCRWLNSNVWLLRYLLWFSCLIKKWKPRFVSFLLPVFRISKVIWCELRRPISKARFSYFLAQHRLLPRQPTCMTFSTVHAPPCQRVTMSRTAYSCGREIPISNFISAKVSRKLLCGFSQSVHTDPSIVRVAKRKWRSSFPRTWSAVIIDLVRVEWAPYNTSLNAVEIISHRKK
jgi:hypothetical protein